MSQSLSGVGAWCFYRNSEVIKQYIPRYLLLFCTPRFNRDVSLFQAQALDVFSASYRTSYVIRSVLYTSFHGVLVSFRRWRLVFLPQVIEQNIPFHMLPCVLTLRFRDVSLFQASVLGQCFYCKLHLLLLLKCCFTSTETVGLLGTGAQDGHLDFHTAPELVTNSK